MARRSLLIFIILLETLHTVYCVPGNGSMNPSSLSKKTELNNSDLMKHKAFSFEDDEKTLEKRRLLFNEGEINAPATAARDFESKDFSTRLQTNYTVTETDIPEYQSGFNNWENKNSFSFSEELENSRHLPEFRLRQPLKGQTNSNHNLHWNQGANIFGTEESHWHEGKNMKHIANSKTNSRIDNDYNGRVAHMIGNANGHHHFQPHEKAELFNRRLSLTTLNDEAMLDSKREENVERLHEMKPDHVGHSSMNYYHRHPTSFWSRNLYTPEKGVVINFNTECPTPKLLNNQMVHKFIFTPKPSVGTLPEFSSFQIPQNAFISTQHHKRPPLYYL